MLECSKIIKEIQSMSNGNQTTIKLQVLNLRGLDIESQLRTYKEAEVSCNLVDGLHSSASSFNDFVGFNWLCCEFCNNEMQLM